MHQRHELFPILELLVFEQQLTNSQLKEIKHIMSTLPSGLQALQTAVSDLTSAVADATAKLADLSAQLSALNSEDPAVQDLAGKIEEQVSALKSAVTPPTA